eukprot:CAMPEP_0196719404 /NCGR_PEP_ID=MMETSP1091-20130531/2382_1 /TAXON_ID=302021 /ORGANISM="Rhodomonas sp., Strain CCMP768" /LENGTH=161 /DNA_ID=CAMNT_0042060341 /DNA_START=67 /DNA_END=552 /DNA_ORIENTATION=-
MNLDLGISGSAAPQTTQRVSTAGSSRAAPIKKDRPDTADEIPVGSGLNDQGLSDVELENMCRLQYARWKDLQEYVSTVGNGPDLWPNGLIKVLLQSAIPPPHTFIRPHSKLPFISSIGALDDVLMLCSLQSTKKKGDDCKFYWKKVPEWRHMWGKASLMRA